MELKRTYDLQGGEQDSCVYAVQVFDGVTDRGSRLVIDKDDWRDPSDPHGWLVRESEYANGVLADRTIVTVVCDPQSRQFWMQLAPDDGAFDRHDYITGWLDDDFKLRDVVQRRGRYETHAVMSAAELTIEDGALAIGGYAIAHEVRVAA